MVPKPSKSIKMPPDGARSKKIAPRTEKDAKKHPKRIFDPPPWHPKSAKIRKKGASKIDAFFDPLLEPTLPHFRLLQGPPKQPKSGQNRSQSCPNSFLVRLHILSPMPMKNTLFAPPKPSKISKNEAKMQATDGLGKRKASKVDF